MSATPHRPPGRGIAVLEQVATEQGVATTSSWLLEGEAIEARIQIGSHRFVWGSNGRRHYLSLHTPKVAVAMHLGQYREGSFFVKGATVATIGGVPIMVEREWLEGGVPVGDATLRWLAVPEHLALLNDLALSRSEWVWVGNAWSLASLVARDQDDFARIERIIDVIDAVTDPAAPWIREERIVTKAFPEPFRDLVPMMRTWAIDDDVVRAERMDRARTASLLTLHTTVAPRLAEIDAYLDAFGDAPPYEATRLGRLAEAAAEARIDLEARGVDSSLLDGHERGTEA